MTILISINEASALHKLLVETDLSKKDSSLLQLELYLASRFGNHIKLENKTEQVYSEIPAH